MDLLSPTKRQLWLPLTIANSSLSLSVSLSLSLSFSFSLLAPSLPFSVCHNPLRVPQDAMLCFSTILFDVLLPRSFHPFTPSSGRSAVFICPFVCQSLSVRLFAQLAVGSLKLPQRVAEWSRWSKFYAT